MNILEFRKVFDFIEEEHPSTELNDTELKSVWEQFNEWQGEKLPVDSVSKSFPLIEGKTKSNVKKYTGVGRQAPPPPARTIKGNVS